MFDENPLSVNVESADSVAATDDTANGETTELTPEAPAEVVEKVETQETKPEDNPAESQDLKRVREWGQGLERDVREKFAPAYTGLERTATALYGAATAEDVLAAAKTVETLAPQLKVLTDPAAASTEVLSTLKSMLPQEHMEALTWDALNNPANRQVIFDDPEVQSAIAEQYFNGRSIDEVLALLAQAPETESDPEREAWRREQNAFKAERQREASEKTQAAASQRSAELADRFFEQPTKRILAEDFKLVAPEGASEADKQLFADTAEDIGYVAQARFAKENMAAFMQIDQLYRQGRQVQAQAAEIRLANRYHATLIKTAERHVNLLKSRSAAVVSDQQGKINGVRPEVSGSVDQGQRKEEAWDIDAPDFAQKFAASFHN